jgi:hypothetical protein
MRKWGELSQQERSSRIKIAIITIVAVLGIMGIIAYLQQPKGYVPEKDTRPVFGQDR